MNRHQRRGQAKEAGISWQAQRERDLMEQARRQTAEARERLARWAARPGHSQAEVDAMNGRQRKAGELVP